MKKIYVLLLSLLLCLGFSPLFAQQAAIYLKADNLTQGVGQTTGFQNYIQLSSLQYGLSNPAPTGSGAGAGKASFSDLTITKTVDLSSTKLMLTLTKGTAIQNLEILFTKDLGGKSPTTLYKIELFNAFVTSYSVSSIPECTSNCPNVAESLSFAYQKIKVTTYTQSPGGQVAANAVFSWDLKENKPF